MTYFWVFQNNQLLFTFDRGYSGSEVPDNCYILHREGEWSTAYKGSITDLTEDQVPKETKALALLVR